MNPCSNSLTDGGAIPAFPNGFSMVSTFFQASVPTLHDLLDGPFRLEATSRNPAPENHCVAAVRKCNKCLRVGGQRRYIEVHVL